MTVTQIQSSTIKNLLEYFSTLTRDSSIEKRGAPADRAGIDGNYMTSFRKSVERNRRGSLIVKTSVELKFLTTVE